MPAPEFAPQTLVEERDTNQSHLRMIYRPEIAVADVRERAALSIYSTLLGGSMGSRLFEEIREKRGLCYSVYALDHAFADVPILQLGSGLESAKCVEAYTRMREIVRELRDDGPTEEEVQRARAYAAGRLVLAFENTNAVARYAANQRIVFGEDIDPDAAIAALDAVTYEEVREVAAGVADKLAVGVRRAARRRGVLGLLGASSFSLAAAAESGPGHVSHPAGSPRRDRAAGLDHRFDVDPVLRPVEHRLEDGQRRAAQHGNRTSSKGTCRTSPRPGRETAAR